MNEVGIKNPKSDETLNNDSNGDEDAKSNEGPNPLDVDIDNIGSRTQLPSNQVS